MAAARVRWAGEGGRAADSPLQSCVKVVHVGQRREPGIYLPAFGVRSEVNLHVAAADLRVTGVAQPEMTALLA